MPLLTLPGPEFAARVGASLALALGPGPGPAMVARDAEDYAAALAALVRRPGRLRRLKGQVRAARQAAPPPPLYDSGRWVRCWEAGLRAAVDAVAAGAGPRHIQCDGG